jgi:hypothetical protein
MKIFNIRNSKCFTNLETLKRRGTLVQLILFSIFVSISLIMPSLSIANVLNGPSYEVDKLGPIPVPNPDPNGAAKCANLSIPVPGGFPYTTATNLLTVTAGGGGASEIANTPASRCYAARVFVYAPKGAPTHKHPAVLMIHGSNGAIPTPGLVDDTYARRLASNGIVVAYFDYPPFSLSGDVAIPSLRMSGVTNYYLHTMLDSNLATIVFVGSTANTESMLVAYDWLVKNAKTYKIDSDAIGTFGDSVGADIAQNNYGLSSRGVVPAGFNFVMVHRPCYILGAHFTGPSATLCNSLPNYVGMPLIGPPLMAVSGVKDTTFPPPFEDDFIRTLQANSIPVDYMRLNATHDAYVRYLDWELTDRQIQFIFAASKNEGCIDSHTKIAGKSACHLIGFQEEIVDNSNASYDSCIKPENRASLGGHTYALCSGYEADQWPRNYNDAKTFCASRGGYLVKVANNVNDPENQLITNWRNDNAFELNPWVDPSLLVNTCYGLSSSGTISSGNCNDPRPFVCEFDQ